MRIKKVSKTTQTGAQIIDGYSNSQVSGYSCNYINRIVESGSNANGNYIKYIDGTLVCYGTADITSPVSYGDWYGFCRMADERTTTLPAEFIDTNYKVIATSYSFGYFSMILRSKTTTTFKFRGCTHNNGSYNPGAGSFEYIAIGRWK